MLRTLSAFYLLGFRLLGDVNDSIRDDIVRLNVRILLEKLARGIADIFGYGGGMAGFRFEYVCINLSVIIRYVPGATSPSLTSQ